MPYSEKAHRYFEAISHGWVPSGKKSHPSQEEAKKLAAEGIDTQDEGQKRALRAMKEKGTRR
jgi:hypothetical protein